MLSNNWGCPALLALKWSDVDLRGRKLTLRTSKRSGGQEADVVNFTPELEALLAEQRRFVQLRSEYVFPAKGGGPLHREYGKNLRFWCARAGVKPFGFHGIRHLSASMLDDAGKPLTLIQAILRHKSATTTARYLHSLRGARAELGDAFKIEKAPGMANTGGSLSKTFCA